MRRVFHPRVLFLAALSWAGGLLGQTLITISDYTSVITAIDTATLTTTTVGTVTGTVGNAAFTFGDLTWDSANNQIYMILGRGDSNLYTLNPLTGVATLVGLHGISNDLFALAYDSGNNTLYAATFSGPYNLYTLNPNTGASTLVGPTGVSLGSMAYDSLNGVLYGLNDGSGNLYQIDPLTGAATLVTNQGYTNDSGLVFDPNRNLLWAADASGNLYSYDLSNGFARTTVLTGLRENDGLVFIGVPEPSTLGLLASGLACAGLAMWRRRRPAAAPVS